MAKNNVTIQSDAFDVSTDEVMSWIHYLAPNTVTNKLFDTTNVEDIEIRLGNNFSEIKINEKEVISREQSFWYRRGQFNFLIPKNKILENRIANEYIIPIKNYIENIDCKQTINKYSDNNIEKLNILNDCVKLGITIPETLITSSIESVKNFLNKHKKIICKPAKNPFTKINIHDQELMFSSPTVLISLENIDSFPTKFLLSLFQNYVEKQLEIRCFYLREQFYSMAIFSQNNPKTRVDFRNYDHENPNRVVPYQIPSELEIKLVELMKLNRLSCGSFDIILTPKDEYVFLEVNPIGQFQWLSRNCNYYLEKLIAKYLTD